MTTQVRCHLPNARDCITRLVSARDHIATLNAHELCSEKMDGLPTFLDHHPPSSDHEIHASNRGVGVSSET